MEGVLLLVLLAFYMGNKPAWCHHIGIALVFHVEFDLKELVPFLHLARAGT
jgi:hypothetical protein